MHALMAIILLFLVLGAFLGSKAGKTIPPYMGGRAVDTEGRFLGSLGVYKEAKTSNYYLEEYCGEKTLLRPMGDLRDSDHRDACSVSCGCGINPCPDLRRTPFRMTEYSVRGS